MLDGYGSDSDVQALRVGEGLGPLRSLARIRDARETSRRASQNTSRCLFGCMCLVLLAELEPTVNLDIVRYPL